MKKYIFLLAILIGINMYSNAYSQPIFSSIVKKNNKNFDVRLSANIKTALTRYNHIGTEIPADTLVFYHTDTTTDSTSEYRYQYTTDLSQQKYNLHIGYIGLENFYIYAKLPFVYTNVKEIFSQNENMPQRRIKNDESDNYLEGINFDAGYILPFEKIDIHLIGGAFFPFGKWHKPIDLDTSAPINDKWLNLNRKTELNIGTIADIKLKPIHFQIGCRYNYRAGNFNDRILINFLVGLNSVDNTEMSANLKYNTPLSNYKEEYAISFWAYPFWSNTLDLELRYKMFFTDKFYIDVGYDLPLYGKNTLAIKTVNISIGYLF